MQLLTRPEIVEVKDSHGRWAATFTEGAYTAASSGPARTFAEPGVQPDVTHAVWVRTLAAPFNGVVDRAWLKYALRANQRRSPDVLAIAMQYIAGAPPIFDGELRTGGEASYGPLIDGEREEGADFNDYLGIRWTYPDQTDKPEERQFGCLDCSGYMRIVWGYRHHLPGDLYSSRIPLCLKPQRARRAMPRRAVEICESAPGVMVVENADSQVKDFSRLAIGDLVFFDADSSDGAKIDHVGIYLGPDSRNNHRFLSSRKRANGPTLGDLGGKSILDGTGLYAKAFRAVRRV